MSEQFILFSLRDPGPIQEIVSRMILAKPPVLQDLSDLSGWARKVETRVQETKSPVAVLTCDKRGVHLFYCPDRENTHETSPRAEFSIHPTPGRNYLVRLSWSGLEPDPGLLGIIDGLEDRMIEAQFQRPVPRT